MSGKRWFTTILVVTTLILIELILVDGFPLLRGPAPETSEWYWPYRLRPLARWWAPLLAAVGMWATAVWWINGAHNKRWGTALGLVGLVLTHFLLQLSLIYADRPEVRAELVDRTLSNLASGFFEPAAEITDLNAVLRNYPQMMPTFASEHARTHPPGFIVANWLTIKAFTAVPRLSEATASVVWPLRCTDLWLLNRPAAVATALAFWSLLPLLLAAPDHRARILVGQSALSTNYQRSIGHCSDCYHAFPAVICTKIRSNRRPLVLDSFTNFPHRPDTAPEGLAFPGWPIRLHQYILEPRQHGSDFAFWSLFLDYHLSARKGMA